VSAAEQVKNWKLVNASALYREQLAAVQTRRKRNGAALTFEWMD